jgi:transcriptional regulator with XRE-family HTH domain
MAEKLGVWRNSVARWERDEMAISEPVARLIEILGKNKRRGK